MTNQELWQAVLAQIQFHASPANFATWFKNTGIFSEQKGHITISVPNNFSKEWLEGKYNKLILKIMRGLGKNVKGIEYVVNSPTKKENLRLQKNRALFPEDDQLQFQKLNLDKETNLNPRYTFDNFVVGPFNELAHAAAWAVSKKPGEIYNPLFIYGGVGLGKTHLMEAVGNKINIDFPTKKIRYVTSERFTAGVVTSIKNGTIEAFKSKFREIDVLILDDIQFIAGKEKTQDVFFHTFNVLHGNNKQIVLSSDRLPNAIPSLEERLRSRFEGGMMADIGLPDFETRVAILEAKSQARDISFSKEVLEYVASNIKRNIRELEGALNRLIVYQKVNSKAPTLAVAKTLLKDLIISHTKTTAPEKIIKTVAEFYNKEMEKLLGPLRSRELVRARHIAMYLLRKELNSSYPFIGKTFGGRDHTTVIHACKKIAKQRSKNSKLEAEINLILQQTYKT